MIIISCTTTAGHALQVVGRRVPIALMLFGARDGRWKFRRREIQGNIPVPRVREPR